MERLRRRLSVEPIAFDTVIALALTVLALVSLLGSSKVPSGRAIETIALTLLQTLPLILRRRYPIAVLIVTVAASIGAGLLAGGESYTSTLGPLVALFTVAELTRTQVAVPVGIAMALAIGALIVSRAPLDVAFPDLVQTELIIFITWGMGRWSRTRRLYTGAIEDRARLLELDREAREAAAIQQEQARIARELHDVIAHHVSVIVIQAGAALHAIERRPDAARDALTAIDATGRQALAEMRRMLGVLGDETDPLMPMPGLDQLGDLLAQVQAAGVPVELSIVGERRPLDAGVELSAYRIIQEALTNTLKHARGARAHVERPIWTANAGHHGQRRRRHRRGRHRA